MKCKYRREGEVWKGYSISKFGNFVCNEDAVKDGYCIFHHPMYWKENEEEVRKKFMEKVNSALQKGEELICIGYNLPKIDISGKKFNAPVYFDYTVFHEDAVFLGTEFSKASFIGVKFSKVDFGLSKFSEAKFGKAEFSEADFRGAVFLGRTYFDFSTFSKSANFEGAKFLPDLLEKCLDPENLILFRRVTFKEPENVVFDGCDMRRVSFIHTNIERVKFRNVEWGDFRIYDDRLLALKLSEKERKKFIKEGNKKLRKVSNDEFDSRIIEELGLRIAEKIRDMVKEKAEMNFKNLKKLRRKVREEIKRGIKEIVEKLDEKEKSEEIRKYANRYTDLTEDNILSVYRALRENYDYHLKYEESGKFFVREMELRKRLANPVEKNRYTVLQVVQPLRGELR